MSKVIVEGLSIGELIDLIREVVRAEFQSISDTSSKTNTYLSREQVCNELHISLPTFHRWTRQGKLKVHKAGSRVLVKKTDVEACLQAITTEKAHAPP